MIKLSSSVSLPDSIATSTFAVLGIRGSGKTTTCVVIAEDLLRLGYQVVVIDPTDVWWGLRTSRDGTEAGLPVVIFGGRHGHVPLRGTDGNVVADLVVDDSVSCVLSLRHLESQAEQQRFVTDFARRVYFRKGEEGNDRPLLIIFDEAHLFVPQWVRGNASHMVSAVQKLVRQGRSSGIGVGLIDQRASSVNKDVLTQLDLLIAHRTSAPQDRKALTAWIEQHDESNRKAMFLQDLATLPRGDAWLWSPSPAIKVFQKVEVRDRTTFDSSLTPDAHRLHTPLVAAQIDVAAILARLASPDDPAPRDVSSDALREELRKAKAELAAQTKRAEEAEEALRVVHHEVKLVRIHQKETLKALEALVQEVSKQILATTPKPGPVMGDYAHPEPSAPPPPAAPEPPKPARTASPKEAPSEDGPLPKGQSTVLRASAQFDGGVSRQHLTVLTGYKRSTRDAYVVRLQTAGLVEITADRKIVATQEGIAALGPAFEKLPTGDKLREHWMHRLPAGERSVLAELVKAYPKRVQRVEIDKALGYARSTRDAYVQRLVVRQIVVSYGDGTIQASPDLFSSPRGKKS